MKVLSRGSLDVEKRLVELTTVRTAHFFIGRARDESGSPLLELRVPISALTHDVVGCRFGREPLIAARAIVGALSDLLSASPAPEAGHE